MAERLSERGTSDEGHTLAMAQITTILDDDDYYC